MTRTTKKRTAKKKSYAAKNKTTSTKGSVARFIASVDEGRRADVEKICELMQKATRSEPEMWGKSIVGFGHKQLRYASGRELDWFLVGFSPRKRDLTLYIMPGFSEYEALTEKLGKFKTGKSCLYIKSLDDISVPVLKKLITKSVADMRKG